MKFCLQLNPQVAVDKPAASLLPTLTEQVRIADAVGFDAFSMGDHYNIPGLQRLNQVPALARLCAEAKNCAVGTAVMLPPERQEPMNNLLADLRIVELSAFVAAPLGGMTMAQFGAEVIRIDPLRGAIDYNRWPVTDNGTSLYWAGLNKAKRSVALALDKPEGREIARAIATAPGPGAGIVLTNLPPLRGLDYASLKAGRDDVILLRLIGNRDGSAGGRLHGQRRERLSAGHRQQRRRRAIRSTTCCRPGTSRPGSISRRRCSRPSATAAAPARVRRSSPRSATYARDGRHPRLCRRRAH